MDAEFASLVGCGADHAAALDAANDHWLAEQFGAISLFDGRIESIHIDMNDRRVVVHGRDRYTAFGVGAEFYQRAKCPALTEPASPNRWNFQAERVG